LNGKILLNLSDYDLVVFDCDGTLLKSNKLKTQALQNSLSNYPKKAVENFINYHKTHGGISRFTKFKYFFEEIMKVDDYYDEYEDALRVFSSDSMQKLRAAPLMPGVSKLLSILGAAGMPLLVASGAAQEDLRLTLKELQIEKFFQYIGGSPDSKTQIVKKFMLKMPSTKIRGLFFGDALSDYEAAISLNFKFICVSEDSEWTELDSCLSCKGETIIENFDDIQIN
jgi:phosphoglycolate phosphatase-like HAD superfamily hydrolase